MTRSSDHHGTSFGSRKACGLLSGRRAPLLSAFTDGVSSTVTLTLLAVGSEDGATGETVRVAPPTLIEAILKVPVRPPVSTISSPAKAPSVIQLPVLRVIVVGVTLNGPATEVPHGFGSSERL